MREAIMRRSRLKNVFDKTRCTANWDSYLK